MAGSRATYGLDAPGVMFGLGIGGLAELTLAWVAFAADWPATGRTFLYGGIALVVTASLFAHTTLRGKFRVWDQELDRLGLTGTERSSISDAGAGSCC